MKDIDGAIVHALLNPIDHDPLPELLFPGMKLTIAFDDISLPLPPMTRPDIRQRVIEAVLDMAADAGVDDVHIIAALALHRRMTEAELRHAVGDRVYDAFAPRGLALPARRRGPRRRSSISARRRTARMSRSTSVRSTATCSSTSTSTSSRWTVVGRARRPGSAVTRASGTTTTRQTMEHTRSFMDQHKSELHKSNWRMGKVLVDSGVKVFQIETTMNTDTFPKPFGFLSKREWEWNARDRATFVVSSQALKRTPTRMARNIFHSIESPHQMTSVQAGEVEAVHKVTTENVWKQQLVEVQGQTDILTMGIPFICPYNVNSIMNPILVMCMGLGYLFNMYRGKPLVREGGVVIMTHPTPWDFHPVHHPSYIDFFEQVLSETTDPHVMSEKYEKRFAEDEWYKHLYRTSYAYHGVHPFYMWYWGAHGMQHCSRVIIVGGDVKAVRRLGFTPASTMDDAFEIASDVVGRTPTITHIHTPPVLVADVKVQATDCVDGTLIGNRDDVVRSVARDQARPRAAGTVEDRRSARRPSRCRAKGFPYRKPNVPRGVDGDTRADRSSAATTTRRGHASTAARCRACARPRARCGCSSRSSPPRR